jgi:hypothetical protein
VPMSVRRSLVWPSLLAAGVAVAGCGSSSASGGGAATGHAAATASSATATVRATSSTAAPPPPRLHIIAPRHGLEAKDGTVLVRIAVLGAHGRVDLRYVLDGHRSRGATRRFVIDGLAPGRHHLVVMLSGDRAVFARTAFAVRKPPPPPPAPPPPTMTQTVAPTMSSPAPMMGSTMR